VASFQAFLAARHQLDRTYNRLIRLTEARTGFPANLKLIAAALNGEANLTESEGVRGKYYRRATAGTNLVLLDPDVAKAFPTSKSVNSALRKLVEIATETARGK
jgi:hypothetical protein